MIRLAASERPATPSSPMPTMDSHRSGVQFPLAIELDELGAEHMRVLILGGTTEASELARLIAGDNLTGDRRFDATLSLAGRTINPKALPLPTRVGGFGGVDGLARWLIEEHIEAVIDATHPYAPNISRNAVAACRRAGVPLGSLGRPAWPNETGDRWIDVPDAIAAARALGEATARIFLSLGRLEIAAFASAPQHRYIARSIDPPGDVPLPPDIRFIFARGPFDEAAERALLQSERIEVIVSKNSGGSATYPKIAAARALGIPVVMIERPLKAAGTAIADANAAIAWLEALNHPSAPSRRGV